MLQNHILLALLWILFGVFHSVLASTSLKERLFRAHPALRPCYRAGYVLFAVATMAAVLWFQLSIASPLVLGRWAQVPGTLLALAGGILMAVCIRKYFLSLSGLRSLAQHSDVPNELRVDGVHRFARHPLYLGTFLFIWGLFGLLPYASLLVMNVVVHGYTLWALRYEEAKLHREFGAAYARYAQSVPRVWPKFRVTQPL
ncbi:MAG: isoprenylcysteine carboxylmethyltransferase family protein [Chitinophagaceae bacterium]|nr:MAG: isoprenylcysteine carboxylmethyltransferase family protein [Chitinophagaceae bacterium]